MDERILNVVMLLVWFTIPLMEVPQGEKLVLECRCELWDNTWFGFRSTFINGGSVFEVCV